MKKRKNIREKGITLVALVVTIVVLLILAGVTISFALSNNGIIEKARIARDTHIEAQENETKQLNEIEKTMEEINGVHKDEFNEEKKVNSPVIKTGLVPVKFENGNIVHTTKDDEDWYDYNSRKWANAQSDDGSLWVWIPRFAYRIKTGYHLNQTGTIEIKFLKATTDDYYNEDGTTGTAQRCGNENEIVNTTSDFTVHPAFTNESSINYRNGGWDKELTGIWVSKFEAGYANAKEDGTDILNGTKVISSDNKNTAPVKESSVYYNQPDGVVWAPPIEGKTYNASLNQNDFISSRNWIDGTYENNPTKIKYPTFQGSTYSMNYINHNDSYLIAKALTETGNIYGFNNNRIDSHLVKNSEWGAIAYLSHSKYGYIGAGKTDIALNTKNLNNGDQSVTKENGNKKASAYAVTGYNDNNQEWNNGGESASSTANIYGIYDLRGGLWERTTGYVANSDPKLKKYGSNMVYNGENLITKSNKYITVYPSNDSGQTVIDTASSINFGLSNKIYGDAVYETSSDGQGKNSWTTDYSHFPALDAAFFVFGGRWSNGEFAGLFSYDRDNGFSHFVDGFRVVLVEK